MKRVFVLFLLGLSLVVSAWSYTFQVGDNPPPYYQNSDPGKSHKTIAAQRLQIPNPDVVIAKIRRSAQEILRWYESPTLAKSQELDEDRSILKKILQGSITLQVLAKPLGRAWEAPRAHGSRS